MFQIFACFFLLVNFEYLPIRTGMSKGPVVNYTNYFFFFTKYKEKTVLFIRKGIYDLKLKDEIKNNRTNYGKHCYFSR